MATKIEYKNKDWLTQKYITEKLSSNQIAKLIDRPGSTIRLWLIKFNIPTRTIGESSVGRKARLNHPHSDETKKQMRESHLGDKNANWKGGITFTLRLFRKSKIYQRWRLSVLKRDNFRCQKCGVKTNIVHHVFSIKDYPDLIIEITNGQTLCLEHHKLEHKKRKYDKN